MKSVQSPRFQAFPPEYPHYGIIFDLKEESPAFRRTLKEGQLKERSEGFQAQWQTALGVVMAAGS
jgi:hypothetical protein